MKEETWRWSKNTGLDHISLGRPSDHVFNPYILHMTSNEGVHTPRFDPGAKKLTWKADVVVMIYYEHYSCRMRLSPWTFIHMMATTRYNPCILLFSIGISSNNALRFFPCLQWKHAIMQSKIKSLLSAIRSECSIIMLQKCQRLQKISFPNLLSSLHHKQSGIFLMHPIRQMWQKPNKLLRKDLWIDAF